jgi:hypothetical protein
MEFHTRQLLYLSGGIIGIIFWVGFYVSVVLTIVCLSGVTYTWINRLQHKNYKSSQNWWKLLVLAIFFLVLSFVLSWIADFAYQWFGSDCLLWRGNACL